jgi:hypothetical protein
MVPRLCQDSTEVCKLGYIGELAKKHIHVWCYAHTAKFNSLILSRIAQRMNGWIQCLSSKIGADKLKKLNTIGNARWWAKAGAIQKIFGKYA